MPSQRVETPEIAVVAVTEGIMRILTPAELKGVLAHELGHVKNRDILVSSIAATLAGAIMILASMARWAAIFGGFRGDSDDDRGGGILAIIVTAILAPIAATLIQLAISRSREYLADETGARLAHNPGKPCPRPGEAGRSIRKNSDGRQSLDGSFVYCKSPFGPGPCRSVQHSSPHRGKNPAAAVDELRVVRK